MSKRDYYEILGVGRDSSTDEIKKAYRKLALKYHPDKNMGDKDSEEKFKEITEAYAVLNDPEKKQRYDQFGHAGLEGMNQGGGFGFSNFGGFDNIFDDLFDIFGSGGRQSNRTGARAGSDLSLRLRINFSEAVFGLEKDVDIDREEACPKCDGKGYQSSADYKSCPRCNGTGELRVNQGFFSLRQPCPDCHGEGKIISKPCPQCHGSGTVKKTKKIHIKIPPGVDNGTRLRVTGQGNKGIKGGPAGDLYILLEVNEHSFFKRDGMDIHCTVPITFSQAALGTSINVPTLKGKVELKIPAGTQSHKIFKLSNKGVPSSFSSYRTGHQFIHVIVETPVNLTKEQKALFVSLEKFSDKKFHPKQKSFFEKIKNIFN